MYTHKLLLVTVLISVYELYTLFRSSHNINPYISSIDTLKTQCNIDWENTLKFGSFYAIPSYYTKLGYLPNNIKSDATLSIATMCDINRLSSAKQIAINFNGPVSIAIYTDFIENEILNETICNKVKQYFNDMNNKYDIYISILYPDYTDKYYRSLNLYHTNVPFYARFPINSLRNLAVSQVKTKYVSILDADFMYMSAEINTINTINNTFIFDDSKTAWIIPSFEWTSFQSELFQHINTKYTPNKQYKYLLSKTDLLKLISNKHIRPFYEAHWKMCQICTDYNTWYNSKNNYMIDYCSISYEPFIIIKTIFAKQYNWNNQFIGPYADKTQQITLLAHYCFQFVTINDLFIIHEYSAHNNVNRTNTKQHKAMHQHYVAQLNSHCSDVNSCLRNNAIDVCSSVQKEEDNTVCNNTLCVYGNPVWRKYISNIKFNNETIKLLKRFDKHVLLQKFGIMKEDDLQQLMAAITKLP